MIVRQGILWMVTLLVGDISLLQANPQIPSQYCVWSSPLNLEPTSIVKGEWKRTPSRRLGAHRPQRCKACSKDIRKTQMTPPLPSLSFMKTVIVAFLF